MGKLLNSLSCLTFPFSTEDKAELKEFFSFQQHSFLSFAYLSASQIRKIWLHPTAI